MKGTKPIDVQALQEGAKNSEHKESYGVLEKSDEYQIGVGARLGSTGQLSFFFEVLVYLCPSSSGVDLPLLERSLMFLRELQSRGYSLTCQDDGSMSCEIIVPPQDLAAEHGTIKSMTKRIFKEQR